MTTPVMNSEGSEGYVVQNNAEAAEIMAKYEIPIVDMHTAIIDECGDVPQASCLGIDDCWTPHCAPEGYEWLASGTIAPAIRVALGATVR